MKPITTLNSEHLKRHRKPLVAATQTFRIRQFRSDGTHFDDDITRLELLEQCRNSAKLEIPSLPFGEVLTRDLRMLESGVTSTTGEPKIQVRTLCVLVSLDPIHAFILSDFMILFYPDGADTLFSTLEKKLKELLDEAKQATEREKLGEIHHILNEENIQHHSDHHVSNVKRKFSSSPRENKTSTSSEPLPLGVGPQSNNLDNVETIQEEEEDTQQETGKETLQEGIMTTSAGEGEEIQLKEEKTVKMTEETQNTITKEEEKEKKSKKNKDESSPRKSVEEVTPNNNQYVRGKNKSELFGTYASFDNTLLLSPKHKSKPSETRFARSVSFTIESERPFQLIALEALFFVLGDSLKKQTLWIEDMARDAYGITQPDAAQFKRIHEAQLLIEKHRSKLNALRKALNEFFQDDLELSLMSFDSLVEHYTMTDEEAGWSPFPADKTEAENITENTLILFDELISIMDQAQTNLEYTNSNLSLQLNALGNKLLKLTVIIQAVTAGAAVAALVAGIFGMNLYTGLDTDSDSTNFWIVFSVLLGGLLIFVIVFMGCVQYYGLLDGLGGGA